jgi:hypothetical protein
VGEDFTVKVKGNLPGEKLSIAKVEAEVKDASKLVQIKPLVEKSGEGIDSTSPGSPYESSVTFKFTSPGNWRLVASGPVKPLIRVVTVTE